MWLIVEWRLLKSGSVLRSHHGWCVVCAPQDKLNMFKEMHKVRNMYLARLHERLARDLMRQRMADDSDRCVGETPALEPFDGLHAAAWGLSNTSELV